jgi:ferredoxin-nitrite reductase
MAVNHYTEFKEDIEEFKKVARLFYKKELTVPEYKSLSGGFGSYAQRGGEKSMLRLRFAGGEIDCDNLSFIVDSIKKYNIDLIHFTTCQTVQLHNLSEDTVCELVGEAYEHGIITRGGGGDFPRNVMCSPLSGVKPDEYFDVLPYAKEAADYLLGFIHKVKLPRKLKVCFCNNEDNETHATFRDMGFVANKNNKFDVYIAGGLGIKPKMGICVIKDLEPQLILYCIKTMVDVFTKYGNYENRAASRTRFLQDSLGVDNLKKIFCEQFDYNLEHESLTLEQQGGHLKGEDNEQQCACQQNGATNKEVKNDAFSDASRVIPQKQEGLYAVLYHPIGGVPSPSFFSKMLPLLKANKAIKLRISPNQGLYIINLCKDLVEKVLSITKDSAQNEFEASTACIGAAICQVGIGNSQALLESCVARVRQEHFKEHVLPAIHISGCPSSCGTQQVAALSFRGGKKPTPEGPQFAFAVYEDGEARLNKERFAKDVGVMLATDIPEFLVDLGKEISAQGLTYEEFIQKDPDGLKRIAQKYL